MKLAEIDAYRAMTRFPLYRERIKQLFTTNQDFKILCCDYRKCSKALDFWNKSDLCEASQRRDEYQKLLQKLEGEILLYLQSDAASGAEKG